MAETRDQLNVKIVPATKALLQAYCHEKRTTQNDVVDAALQAFLRPKEGDDLPMVMLQQLHNIAAKQGTLEEGVAAMVPLLASIVERLEDAKTEPAMPIARYDQMYAALRMTPAEEVVEAPPIEIPTPVPSFGGWWRVFVGRLAP